MLTENQEKLAIYIASRGLMKYSSVAQLIEERSAEVEQLKLAAQQTEESYSNASFKSPVDHPLNRAYIFARSAEESGAAKFGSAYIAFLRQNSDHAGYKKAYQKKVADIKSKLLAQGKWINCPADKERLMPEWLKMLEGKDAYMEYRIEICMQGA